MIQERTLLMIHINENSCLNNRYKKSACNRCQEICPSKCIHEGLKINFSNCDDCGMCLAVCPAEAIASSEVTGKALQELIVAEESPLILSCHLRDKQNSWPCLGFLDARLLVVLVLSSVSHNRQIVLDNQLCNHCKPQVDSYLRDLVAETNQILIPVGKNPIIQGFDTESIKKREKLISRRNFLKSFVKEGAKIIVESLENENFPAPLPRQELFSEYGMSIDVPAIEPTKLFSGISFSTSCQACGLCERICPHKAISIQDHGGQLDFYHNSLICSSCDVCAVNCPQAAIALKPAACLGIYKIAERKLPRCAQCGNLYKPIANQEICLECFVKNTPLEFN